MAQRPPILVHFVIALLAALSVKSALNSSKRDLTLDFFFNFLKDFQPILYHELLAL
jgi:hypothetical protein